MHRLLALLVLVLVPLAARAQSPAPLRVALTCQRAYCDPDFQRTELAFVAFVREPADADVQALVTADGNGSGGLTYTVRLIGQGRVAGRSDTYTIPFAADATDDVQRRGLARTLAAGLMPFLAQTDGLAAVTIAARTGVSSAAAPAAPERDPWDRWVFSTTFSGSFDGSENNTSQNTRLYASASRITEGLIARVSASANRNLNRFKVDSVTTVRNEQTSARLGGLLAHSLDARTTIGGSAVLRTSTFDNTDFSASASVGVERSLYPYSQSTSRLVTLRYNLGAEAIRYRDTTIYDRTSEVLLTQSARLGIDLRQPWGTVGLYTMASHILNHPDQYSLMQAASVDVRLFKGFSVGFYGGVNLTRDQRGIVRRGASRDDVLLQRRALLSGYDYFGGFGMRYTFGSALSGVVNNRFQDGYSISFSY